MLLAMYLPPPSKIAIIGAGPLGLEAALYGRYLGYAVEIFERGRVAENVLRHGDEMLPGPFELHSSSLGLAALTAQDESFRPPAADEMLTCRQWVQRYLIPLAHSDLVADGLREQSTVVRVEQLALVPQENDGDDSFDDAPPPPSIRLQCRTTVGDELAAEANVIINAAGGESVVMASDSANCFVLGGAALPDRQTSFTEGLEQIRTLFSKLADRDGLDLYATV
jgi:hypothetical protein